jgi:hypothetical protein
MNLEQTHLHAAGIAWLNPASRDLHLPRASLLFVNFWKSLRTSVRLQGPQVGQGRFGEDEKKVIRGSLMSRAFGR